MSEEHKKKLYNIFLKWYAMPQKTRIPQTISEFCLHFSIPESLIAEFQQEEEFTEDLYRTSIAWGKSKIPELLHMLYEKYIQSKNPNDLRMYKDLLNLDKGEKKKDDEETTERKGLLRELFEATR